MVFRLLTQITWMCFGHLAISCSSSSNLCLCPPWWSWTRTPYTFLRPTQCLERVQRETVGGKGVSSWAQCCPPGFQGEHPWSTSLSMVSILASGHLPILWPVADPVAGPLQQVSLLPIRTAFQQVSLASGREPPFKFFCRKAGGSLSPTSTLSSLVFLAVEYALP